MTAPLSDILSDKVPAYWCVVPAAGAGRRMKNACPKQYLKLDEHTVLEHTLQRLLSFSLIQQVVVVVSPEDEYFQDLAVMQSDRVVIAEGGAERYLSVLNGLSALDGVAADDDWVMVHDAARPCIRLSDLQKLVDEAGSDSVGGLLACQVSDTIKRERCGQRIEETVERHDLWHAMTPQMFRKRILQQALTNAVDSDFSVTDDASAIELAGLSPKLVSGHSDNIKITRQEDLALAAFLLSRQQQDDCSGVIEHSIMAEQQEAGV